jgi:Protein of unknown function (DUF559)
MRIVTMEQATASGFSIRQVYRLVASGDWTRLHEGVFLMSPIPNEHQKSEEGIHQNSEGIATTNPNQSGRLPLGQKLPEGLAKAVSDETKTDEDKARERDELWKARLWGLLVRGGPNTLISHRSAARLHGMEGIEGYPVEATVGPDGRMFAPGIHRTRHLDRNPSFIDGISTTSIERTLRDIASICSFEVVEQCLESVLRGPDRTRPDIWNSALLALIRESVKHQAKLPGTFRLGAVLQGRSDLDRPTGSFPETLIFQVLRDMGFTCVRQPTVRIVDGSGATLDTLYPDLGLLEFRLLLEVDGEKGHSGSVARARDLNRQNKLVRGFRILRLTASRILSDPHGVADEIRRNLVGVEKVGTQWQFDNISATYSTNNFLVVDRGRDARAEAEIARRRRAN